MQDSAHIGFRSKGVSLVLDAFWSFVETVLTVWIVVFVPLIFICLCALHPLYGVLFFMFVLAPFIYNDYLRELISPKGLGETFNDVDFSLKAEALSWLAEEKARREHMKH